MHPILYSFGPFHLRAYGLALAAAFLAGSWLVLKRGPARGIREEVLTGLIAWILISSVVGARLLFVVAHPDQFASVWDALRIWEGGLTQYGGLIAAVLASWIYLRRARQAFLPVADLVAPSLALGEGITRIGCFINGCCFGRACSTSWAVHFPPHSYASQTLGAGVGVWPSQLFLSAGLLLAFFFLLWAERWRLGLGGIFGLFLVLQGVIRYAVDYTRYYEPSDRFAATAPLLETHSQLIALLLFLAGVVFLVRARRAGSRGGSAPAKAR